MCIRDSSQRAPNGSGWKYSLDDVRRVLYKLPLLKGHPAVLLCEGEKDVDAAWNLGVPATCNPMGAGKWIEEYTKQLTAAGVQRAAIVADNDPPGAQHASAVAKSVSTGGIAARIVRIPDLPLHGDLSDYLTNHTKDQLLRLVRDTPTWNEGPEPPERI